MIIRSIQKGRYDPSKPLKHALGSGKSSAGWIMIIWYVERNIWLIFKKGSKVTRNPTPETNLRFPCSISIQSWVNSYAGISNGSVLREWGPFVRNCSDCPVTDPQNAGDCIPECVTTTLRDSSKLSWYLITSVSVGAFVGMTEGKQVGNLVGSRVGDLEGSELGPWVTSITF